MSVAGSGTAELRARLQPLTEVAELDCQATTAGTDATAIRLPAGRDSAAHSAADLRQGPHRRLAGVPGLTLGLIAALSLYLPIFPSLGGNAQMQELIDSLPTELTRTINYQQIDTGAGYAQSTFFGLIGFLLISMAAISWGAASWAVMRSRASWNSPSPTA